MVIVVVVDVMRKHTHLQWRVQQYTILGGRHLQWGVQQYTIVIYIRISSKVTITTTTNAKKHELISLLVHILLVLMVFLYVMKNFVSMS